MTDEKLFLLDVLKAFIHEEKLNFDKKLDWPKLMQLSTIHSVAGILEYMAIQNPCQRTAPVLDYLKKQCYANIAMFAQRTEKANRMVAKLNGAGIDHVLLKGYVVRNYYPVPELRTYGDIDILIKPEDRKKSHALMLEHGFSVKTDWEPVYSYNSDLGLFELHTELLEIDVSNKTDYREYFRNAWKHTACVKEHTFQLTPEFHFIYLMTHIAKHIYGAGAGIRMYMDIALFIKHFGDNVDWKYVEDELKKLGLSNFANVVLSVSEKCLGVISPIALRDIEPETYENFMEYTMDGGIFGHFGRDSGLIILKNTEKSSRLKTLSERIFPPANVVERRYTYIQGRYWLLPVAWMHRAIKNRGNLKKNAEVAKSILTSDNSEVEKLKRIYREIGL